MRFPAFQFAGLIVPTPTAPFTDSPPDGIKTRRAVAPTFVEQLDAQPRPNYPPELKDADAHVLASFAATALGQLAHKARAGDGKALWQFVKLTADACKGLDQMTAHDRKLCDPLPARC